MTSPDEIFGKLDGLSKLKGFMSTEIRALNDERIQIIEPWRARVDALGTEMERLIAARASKKKVTQAFKVYEREHLALLPIWEDWYRRGTELVETAETMGVWPRKGESEETIDDGGADSAGDHAG